MNAMQVEANSLLGGAGFGAQLKAWAAGWV